MEIKPDVLTNLIDIDLPTVNPFLTSDMTPAEARIMALRQSLFKKWLPNDTSTLDRIAVDSFVAANLRCASWEIPDGSLYVDDILSQAIYMLNTDMYEDYLTPFVSIVRGINRGRHGPGSSNGTKANTHYHKLFHGDMTYKSKSLYQTYRAQISSTWTEAELFRRSICKSAVCRSSKVMTVPKNDRTSRTICVEPSLNMFVQLGLGSCIEDVLRRSHNIDLSTQPDINRAMAREGSVNAKFCTIDLKQASDLIPRKFVEWLLPPEVYRALETARSEYFTLPDGTEHRFEMFASMGNGFTFPLQTLIFATLVRATYTCLGIKPIKTGIHRNYAVFGDDIVCLSDTYHIVCQVLRRAGAIVNDDKSFAVGSFRESCGSDFFNGHNIRGIYLKESKNESHIYSAFNRLSRWSASNAIGINNSLRYIKGLAVFRPIPYDGADDEGFKIPSHLLTCRRKDPNGSIFYNALRRKPRVIEVAALTNPAGLYLSAIAGYVGTGGITVRSDRTSFQVVKCKTPRWDFIPDAGLTIQDYSHVSEVI